MLFCGLSGAGKTTLAQRLKNKLTRFGVAAEVIDADEYRNRMFTDLGYSREHRIESLRRLGLMAAKFSAHGIVTIVSAINPYEQVRRELKASYRNVELVHIDCPLDELKRRDTKGLYARAALPDAAPAKLVNLSGVNDTFEPPLAPDLYFNTLRQTVDDCTGQLFAHVLRQMHGAPRKQA